MKQTLITFAVALCCGFAGSAGAAGMNKDEYKAQKDRIQADYKAAKGKCGPLKGNAQDICKADAKATKTAEEKGPSSTKAAGAARDSRDDKIDAQYSAAKERCDTMSGQAKDNCINDAKKKFGKM